MKDFQIGLDQVTIIYADGQRQTLSDLFFVGQLIDENGDDIEPMGVVEVK